MMDLEGIARRVAASAGQKIYRVITDEPVGICVGFAPSKEALEKVNAEVDEWPLASDDGSNGTPFLTGSGNDVAILDVEIDDPNVPEEYSPLGMDLAVWRSEEEMLEALLG
jgi:hypothetical protein